MGKAGMATGVEVARISVKVSPDTREFRRELKNELEEIERTLKGDVHITAHLDSAQARADFMRLKAAMEKDRVRLGVDLDTDKAGGGKKRKGGVDVPDVPDVPKLGFPWPSFGSGINPAGWAVIIGGIVTIAGPLVGLISAALTAIPGMITLIGAPIAAITLGLDGFKKAAEAIKPQFEELKSVMSQVAESSFTPVLKRVADEVFPRLRDALPAVTRGLADFSQGLLDSLKGNAGTQLENSFRRVGEMFTAMRPGLESFNNAFAGLADQFTMKLPDIANWFNEAMAGFDAWVQKVSADGSLSNAFDGLGAVLDKIMSTIADLAQKGIKFFENPDNIQMTLDLLEGIRDVLTTIMDLSTKIAGAWNDMFHNGIENPDANTKGHGSGRIPASANEFQGPKKDIEATTAAINAQGAAAEANSPKVKQFLEGGMPGASAQRRGVGTEMVGGGGQFDKPAVEPPKVEPPDTSEAKAKLEEYNSFVQQVTGDVKAAMQAGTQGGTVPPPDLNAFKQAWTDLPNVVSTAFQEVTAAVQSGGAEAAGQAVIAGQLIVDSMRGVAPLFQSVGLQMMAGLAQGITAGSAMAIQAAVSAATNALNAAKAALGIKSPSRKFMQVGDFSMQGMALGMEKGFAPVLAQAKDMAFKISEAFAGGGDPTGVLDGFGRKEVSRMEKVLGFESKKLGIQARALDYQAKVTGDSSLKAQAEALRMRKEELDLQKEMMSLTKEYADMDSGGGDGKFADSPMGKAVDQLMGMPQDLFKTVSGQFMSDMGIEGGGAITSLMDYAQGFGSKFVFNVSNLEEAMSAHQSVVNRQAMGVLPR